MWRQKVALVVAAGGLSLLGPPAFGQGNGGMGMRGGMMGMTMDSATMAHMRVIHELVVNNARITRTVTNLPDGVRTVTESADPTVAQLIKEHVTTMDRLVIQGDDHNMPMASPALHTILSGKDKIRATTESTTAGVVIVQTSSDSTIVAALQQHAMEVTDLVKGGMPAMHEAMMKNMHGMMHGMPGDSASHAQHTTTIERASVR